jgi:hypothetical protein
MSCATTMYYTGINPLKPVTGQPGTIYCAKSPRARRVHKAFLRWHDPDNWTIMREALRRMGKEELIGDRGDQLVPPERPFGWRPQTKISARRETRVAPTKKKPRRPPARKKPAR